MLVISRISAYCLNTLAEHYGFGTMVHRFQGDDPDAWCEASVGCSALIHGRPVAVLHMDPLPIGDTLPAKITIHINDIRHIVRPKNLSDFDPGEYGIELNNTINWMGDKEPDIVADIHLEAPEEQIPGLYSPRNFLPQTTMGRTPEYNGSMDRRKLH